MNLMTRDNLTDFDQFLGSFFAPNRLGNDVTEGFFSPKVDIKENGDHYEISAELPGVKKEDLHVHVEDGVLTIEASHNEENTEEAEGKVIRKERRTGRFMRSFNLGSDIQDKDIQASFVDGVLSLKAPKLAEPESKSRKIEIK